MANYSNDKNNTIVTGTNENDYVINTGVNVTINTGAGNDSIQNGSYGSSVTIEGGEGDDSIYNSSSNVLFKYELGDGNDIIHGFNEDSTLNITGGTYSTVKSGDDVIVTVGDGNITLVGAATLSEINIVENPIWKISGTTATYGTSSNTLITVSGVKSKDGLSLSGNTVTVAASALNNSNVTISNDYTLALADGVQAPTTTAASWSYDNNVATYKAASTSAGYSLNNNQIVYTSASGGDIFTVSGVQSTNGLTLDTTNKAVKVSSSASLNTDKVTVSSEEYSFEFASKYNNAAIIGSKYNDTITSAGQYVTIDGGSGNDSLNGGDGKDTLSGGTGDDKLLGGSGNDSLSGGDGKDTLSGGTDDDKLLGGTGNDSLSGGAGKDTLSGGSDNDKLLGGKGNDSLNGGDGKDSLWGGAGDDKLYGGSGDDIFIYKPGEGTDTIFDFKSGDMLKILKADGSAGGSFTSSSFNSNNLTLAISGGGKVIFDNVSASDSFNINGTIHTISGKTLK